MVPSAVRERKKLAQQNVNCRDFVFGPSADFATQGWQFRVLDRAFLVVVVVDQGKV